MALEFGGGAQPGRGRSRRALGTSSQGTEKSFLEENFFSRHHAENTEAAEAMEDLEAELLAMPRMSRRPQETPVKDTETVLSKIVCAEKPGSPKKPAPTGLESILDQSRSKAVFPREQKTPGPAVLTQGDLDMFPDGSMKAGQLHKDASDYHAELLGAQARVAELESQVQMLKLEQTQYNLRLEKLQQHHKEELDHLESTYRRQLKVMEETCEEQEQRLQRQNEQLVAKLLSQSQDAQKARAELVAQHEERVAALHQRNMEDLERLQEHHRRQLKVLEKAYEEQGQRLQRQNEQLVAKLLSQSQEAEKARAELVAQHEERVAALQQRNMEDLERLQEHHRTSLQAMVKDYEAQLQRLRQAKDVEVDAVTSATSHTRLLNSIVEQMRKFSSELHDVSHKVEATHQTMSQELAEQQEKQLKVLEDRLSQQQRDMEEERGRFQKVIARLRSKLSKQSWLLEQERLRQVAEQSKVELQQHSQEEHQQGMTQQLSKERAELEREKSALLEERQKLERDMAQMLQTASEKERTTLSLAKEQAELKAKEDRLVRNRELLEEALLRHEKLKVKGAVLRIQQQEEEIKSMIKQSSQKYEEGERALQEARRIESESQMRLQAVQERFELVKQHEQLLQEERLSMAHQRRQLEQLCEELRRNPVMPQSVGEDLSAPMSGSSGTLPEAPYALKGLVPSVNLQLLKLRAQQDHEFLEHERVFLEGLKNAPYNTGTLRRRQPHTLGL